MDEILRLSFYGRVNDYLNGALPLRDLEDWVLQYDPALLRVPSSDVAQLAGIVALGITDIHHQHISEDDLKAEISDFMRRLPTFELYVGLSGVVTVTESSSDIITSPAVVPVLTFVSK